MGYTGSWTRQKTYVSCAFGVSPCYEKCAVALRTPLSCTTNLTPSIYTKHSVDRCPFVSCEENQKIHFWQQSNSITCVSSPFTCRPKYFCWSQSVHQVTYWRTKVRRKPVSAPLLLTLAGRSKCQSPKSCRLTKIQYRVFNLIRKLLHWKPL